MLWCVWRVKANSKSILFPHCHMGSDIEVRSPGLQGKHLYWRGHLAGLNTFFSFFSLFLRWGWGWGEGVCAALTGLGLNI